MNDLFPVDDRQQWFTRESAYRSRGYMDEIEHVFVTFEEYINLLFVGTPGEFIVRGL